MQFQEDFFSKNRRTLFGALKYRQTLFNAQILLYKDFCDFLRFTRPSSIANAFLPFAIQICKANLRPTYLLEFSFIEEAKHCGKNAHGIDEGWMVLWRLLSEMTIGIGSFLRPIRSWFL